MKIAICTNFFHPSQGGGETVTQKIAEYYAQKHEVTVFTRHLLQRKSKTLGAVNISNYNPTSLPSFLKRIHEFNPDFTLIYSDVFDFFDVAVQQLKNVCVAFCGGNRLCSKPYTVKLFQRNVGGIRSFVCHTKSERDYRLASQLNILDRTYVIPNGVDIEEFDENEMSRKDILSKETHSRWILNVSNFFPGKGQIQLIDILSRVQTQPFTYVQVCSSLEFAIGRHLEQQWKTRANHLSKNGIDIIFMKDKEREKVIAAFKNANVFAFPSQKESAGLVLLESMAAALPWVSLNVGIAPDISGGFCIGAAKDQQYNAIFDERVKDHFAEKIDQCFSQPKLGEDGRKEVEKKYQWKTILPLYEGLL